MSMTTNTLDKKLYNNGNGSYYSLFSYIQKIDPDLQSTRSAIEKKTQEYNYGFINLLPVQYDNTHVFLAVQGVYKSSSADEAGIKRSVGITHVDNQILTLNNWYQHCLKLLQPTSTSTVVVKDYNGKSYTINSGPIYANPVIYHRVKNKIGYLVYSYFGSGFDQELFEVFKQFKNENITDLILDLRYNGGGDVRSANLIASCIAGETCIGKTFASYRYNQERMEVLGNKRDIEKFSYSSYQNLNNISLSAGGLNLRRVYCLVTNNTASASELVINSLEGIGIDVILIGNTTRGKNVGMEGVELTAGTDKYLLFPITFQAYNAAGYGDFENGFTPDFVIDENNPHGKNFEGYIDFGKDDETLYAKAMSQITGTDAASITRSSRQAKGQVIAQPTIGRIGMIKQK